MEFQILTLTVAAIALPNGFGLGFRPRTMATGRLNSNRHFRFHLYGERTKPCIGDPKKIGCAVHPKKRGLWRAKAGPNSVWACPLKRTTWA